MAYPQEQIVVSSAQGVTDALQATLRYVVVIVGFLSGLASLLGKQDAAGAVNYVQTNLGGAVSAAFGLVALGTAAWGIYKTFKRGSQLAIAAEAAPNSVAKVTR
jgi:maltodextrin utilization protein YvdJ